jgi:tetratricopeptide (TPR) repeat protein
MADVLEGPEVGGEVSPGVDPAAIAVALGSSGTLDPRAAEFLKKQEALIEKQGHLVDLQAKELAHELKLRHWSLQLRHASAILKLALEVSAAAVGVAIVCFIGALLWNAAHDDGLIVESFSVPPDLAARGLTGQVVATQLLDNLSDLQAKTVSPRAPSSYANDWGNDLKVEIPDTGVSIGELNNYLHKLLGHQTRISGEVVHTVTGLAVTARSGVERGTRFSGPESDFDALLQQAAEAVYASTQPYRYGIHLVNQGKNAEAIAFFERNRHSGTPTEQVWFNSGLASRLGQSGRVPEAAEAAHAAVAANPDVAFGWINFANTVNDLGHVEAALAANRTFLRLVNGPASKDLRPEAVLYLRTLASGRSANLVGDYAAATKQIIADIPGLDFSTDAAKQVQALMSRNVGSVQAGIGVPVNFANELIADHDMGQIPQALAEAPAFAQAFAEAAAARGDLREQAFSDSTLQGFREVGLSLEAAEGDWAQVLQTATIMEAKQPSIDAASTTNGQIYLPTVVWPVVAQAQAMQGDFAAAHAEIDRTPGDCDLCLRMRGKIDAAQKNYAGAAFWFARAVQLAPSIPFAFTDWGEMLLKKGDPDAAIAQFTIANKKGPHFADPLEGWGEALMAKSQSHLALAKFAEAEKYAPNWGRLHLKWGEALVYAGRGDEARAQFARAAALDLTPSEKAELAGTNGIKKREHAME